MIRRLIQSWWSLALCVVLDAMISVIYFAHAGNGFHASKDVVFLGRLTLAAGVCTIAAGIWNSGSGKSWLLLLNGLALGSLGVLLSGILSPELAFALSLCW